MLRRIVVVNKHEWLAAGWANRSFGAAAADVESNLKVPGVQFHDKVHPIPVFQASGVAPATAAVAYGGGESRSTPPHETYAVVGLFDDEDAVERLKMDRRTDVVGVFADPEIEACPAAYCNRVPEGDYRDVIRRLGVQKLRAAKLTGRGVRVAVVDTGINGAHPGPDGRPLQQRVDPAESFSPTPGYQPGSAGVDHGTMVAFDVLLAAPKATLLDYALLRSTGGTWTSFLSDALAAFADLIELLGRQSGPLVVNNSWAMFDRTGDEPIGTPGNYTANPNHPFNQITASLVAAGADVLFAAGNCGGECPDGRCGMNDVGPGASIHGANSHPSVITVAAVTVRDERLGYSSQGPGGLSPRKPDVAAFSHFAGSGVYKADGGTSAASPVAAGVVAALRQKWPKLAPAVLRGVLQRTARSLGAEWDNDVGFGVIDAGQALAGAGGTAAAGRPSVPRRTARRGLSAEPAWMLTPTTPEERARYAAALTGKGATKPKATKSKATKPTKPAGRTRRAGSRKRTGG